MKRLIFLILLISASTAMAQTTYRLDSLHIFDWDDTMDDWKHNTRELYTYNNGGTKETNLLRLTLNTSDEWENFYQFNKSYNGSNNLTESIQQTWDEGLEVWQNTARFTNSYAGQNVDVFSQYIFSGVDWLLIQQNDFEYDAQSNEIEDLQTSRDFGLMTMVNDRFVETSFIGTDPQVRIEQDWIAAINDWQNEERTEYFYDNGQLIRAEERTWVVGNNDWSDPFERQLLFYNSNNLVDEIIDQTWGGSDWVNDVRILQTYDTNNNILNITSQEWNSSSSSWVNSTRQLRTFDVNDNETELIFENWDAVNDEWIGFLRIVKFWFPAQVLSTEDEQLTTVALFPNPVKELMHIKSDLPIEEVSVYSALGKKVLQIKGKKTINLAHLSRGVYVLKAKTEVGQVSKKIIVD